MFDCQQALLNHLKSEFKAPQINTIAGYAGELKDATKLTEIVPAVLVIYIDGEPAAQDRFHNFDLLVITESRTLQIKENLEGNLKLVTDVTKFLRQKPLFVSFDGVYYSDPEKLTGRTLSIDNRYTIVALSLFIDDRTP